ncbi:hypothetical protein MKX07_008651 [Trichoderma sp. CBMAI-0711]|nr:hypothetical protein MKX07_008651 [Trichoderma sp. CBMAI-0711]
MCCPFPPLAHPSASSPSSALGGIFPLACVTLIRQPRLKKLGASGSGLRRKPLLRSIRSLHAHPPVPPKSLARTQPRRTGTSADMFARREGCVPVQGARRPVRAHGAALQYRYSHAHGPSMHRH